MFEMLTTMMSKTFVKANAIQKFISMCACVYARVFRVEKSYRKKKYKKKN